MNKLIITALLATALTGCMQTARDLREKPPKYEGVTDKKPEAVLGCVTQIWGKITSYQTSYTPLGNGGSVSLDVGTVLIATGNKFGVVDAETVDGRTRVRIYGIHTIEAKQNRKILEAAIACL